MAFRIATIPTVVLGLFLVSSAIAEEPPPPKLQPAPVAPGPANLEKKVADLEKALEMLTKEVRALRQDLKQIAPPVAAQDAIRIFRLKYALAADVEKTVKALLGDKDSQAMRITSDPRTNSLLASGSSEQLEMIEAVLARLDLPDEKSKQPRRSEEQIKEIKDRVALAETELQICQDRFAWSERMVKKGFLSASQVLAEKLRLQYAEMALARAKRELQDLSPERIKEPRQNPGN